MPTNYSAERRHRSDLYLPTVIELIAKHFNVRPDQIREANPDEDMNEATDLIIENRGTRIGVRVRDYRWYSRYRGQFTFRTSPGMYGKSEYDKIKEGYCDYWFVAFLNPDANDFFEWRLIDLDLFRADQRDTSSGFSAQPCDYYGDPDKSFVAFRFDDFIPSIVVASGRQS